MRTRLILIILAGALTMTHPLATAASTSTTYRIIGYFSSWGIYQRGFFVTNIEASLLTHINYAFANVSEDGQCALGDPWADTQFPYPGDQKGEGLLGNFRQLQLLKAANPHLKTLISVGGWTWSGRFSDVALTEQSRATFAASCVAFMTRYGFDGLDIDWEYPAGGGEAGNITRPEDPANFVLLMAELRKQIDAQRIADGRVYLLTIAASASKPKISPIAWDKVYPLLDFINVMAYDFSGPWSRMTGFNAPLYDVPSMTAEGSADRAIKLYLAAGVPADKLVLGVPFYGRGWKDVSDANNGLWQRYGSIPAGGLGVFNWRELADFWISHMTRYWDDAAKVPWLFNAKTGIMISYDDPESMGHKADYVIAQGLGGVMTWELASDDPQHTLLRALAERLNKPTR